MKEVKFICPICGKNWIELQDPNDDWFNLATNQTLCNECSIREIKRIRTQYENN